MWASMYAAYEALSDKMQHLLSDLVAVHDTARSFSWPEYKTEHLGGTQAMKVISTEHPVVRTHPETGRKGLFVNPVFTASIKGMKMGESATLLSFLYRHLETPISRAVSDGSRTRSRCGTTAARSIGCVRTTRPRTGGWSG